MKQKILALTLALLLLAALPLAAYAEGVDPAHCRHDNVGADHVCKDCGTYMGFGHMDDGKTCVCPWCGVEYHGLHWVRNNNETEHWFECPKCGFIREEYRYKHSDKNGDGMCDDCKYGCQHTEMELDRDERFHWMSCPCGYKKTDGEPHVMVDRTCTVCGLVCIDPHTLRAGPGGHQIYCLTCGDVLPYGQHNMVDGKCTVCDYVCDDTHTIDYDQTGHWSNCFSCGTILPWEPHTMVDGVCEICGYTPCPDDAHVFGTEGFEKHRCQICHYTTNCEDADKNCECDICGSEFHEYRTETNDKQHRQYCKKCDLTLEWEDHELHYVFSQRGHWKVCAHCSYVFSGEHTMVDGTCTECGYTPCPDDAHVFGTEGFEKHRCQICHYLTDCEDADKNCECDICGSDCHHPDSDVPYYDEISCWDHCYVCDQEFNVVEHYDVDNNGKCDYCGYVMDGSGDSGDDGDLDDVPKTGDGQLVLTLGVCLCLLTTAAVLTWKKRAI